ncbi:winged helix-turn-helix domain-containing protein [Vulgatibacter incomptus]|uniref:Phosphate regulon transcriptional regulatory protein PhoB (SphR) n=1 Tax=Vulgatibacter incomptus TaxID=1391653 RepID=A0A0K1PEY9_9BACT|nr:response regulator transcription factor [Vulgatibacter incomptus]AKU92072.1 Phosphate regulon transcriptional regulatory protein PhoB (SphR) [Vulgatibacter incomptus]
MAKLLIVEDEADLRDLLSYNLRAAGHEVALAASASEGLEQVRRWRPELILLDLMLPDLPGTELCRRVKGDPSTAATRVVMLTARGEEIDRVVGFELGADDYVSKPFSLRELVLRVNAVLRRGQPAAKEDSAVVVGPLTVDLPRHRVTVSGEEAALTALEFRLLWTLLSRKGRVQTRERLLEDVWEMSPDVTTRTVDTHVKRLREKLGAAGALVETVRGVGYRFAEESSDAA